MASSASFWLRYWRSIYGPHAEDSKSAYAKSIFAGRDLASQP